MSLVEKNQKINNPGGMRTIIRDLRVDMLSIFLGWIILLKLVLWQNPLSALEPHNAIYFAGKLCR